MTGQIPPYGVNFRRESMNAWHPTMGSRIYVLKQDNEWFIRADKSSKQWQLFHGMNRDMATPMGKVQPNFSAAMRLMLDGINEGFYVVRDGVHDAECKLQGSGMNKYCSCPIDNPVGR